MPCADQFEGLDVAVCKMELFFLEYGNKFGWKPLNLALVTQLQLSAG